MYLQFNDNVIKKYIISDLYRNRKRSNLKTSISRFTLVYRNENSIQLWKQTSIFVPISTKTENYIMMR